MRIFIKWFWWWITRQHLKDTKTGFVDRVILKYDENVRKYWGVGKYKTYNSKPWLWLLPSFAVTTVGHFDTGGKGIYFPHRYDNVAYVNDNNDFNERLIPIDVSSNKRPQQNTTTQQEA